LLVFCQLTTSSPKRDDDCGRRKLLNLFPSAAENANLIAHCHVSVDQSHWARFLSHHKVCGKTFAASGTVSVVSDLNFDISAFYCGKIFIRFYLFVNAIVDSLVSPLHRVPETTKHQQNYEKIREKAFLVVIKLGSVFPSPSPRSLLPLCWLISIISEKKHFLFVRIVFLRTEELRVGGEGRL
jgi:hypothetical protein